MLRILAVCDRNFGDGPSIFPLKIQKKKNNKIKLKSKYNLNSRTALSRLVLAIFRSVMVSKRLRTWPLKLNNLSIPLTAPKRRWGTLDSASHYPLEYARELVFAMLAWSREQLIAGECNWNSCMVLD